MVWSNVLKNKESYGVHNEIALLCDAKNKINILCKKTRANFALQQNCSAKRGSVCVQQKGITLIALVVTIVIMLILAGVSINMVLGENGLIPQARWAAFTTEMQTLAESINMAKQENSLSVLYGQASPSIFTNQVDLSQLPKSLKMEIFYIRENLPDDKEPTKDYYLEDLLDYLIEDAEIEKDLYYIPQKISNKAETYYIYDTLTDTAFRVDAIKLKGKKVHSYKYGSKVMGSYKNVNLNTSKYTLTDESSVVTVNDEKYYAPNLKGFNALTTQIIYYNDDFTQKQDVGLSIYMNKQVTNNIVAGDTNYKWYDYANKQWANIKTNANGYEAWWVWIPRYAYKIDEEATTDTNNPAEISIIFVDTEGKPLNTEKYGNILPAGYQVHPAFTTDKPLKGIWLSKYKPSFAKDKENNLEMSSKISTPDLSGFDAENTYLVKYSDNGTTEESQTKLSKVSDLENFNSDKKWYDYENKVWANVVTKANGQEAWWVWIPRYAYKLPDNPNNDTEIIFIDANNKPLDTAKFGNTIPEGYIVHPAFDQDTNGDGEPLTGIWVSKYKPSFVKDTVDDLPMSSIYPTPDLSGFDAENTYLVKYSDNGATEESQTKLSKVTDLENFNSDKKWYDYENKVWANVVTKANDQEAWWVWIPRYAYKLPDNPNNDTEIIFIDTNNKPLDTAKFGNTIPEGYIVHPAFDQDTDSSGKKLTGIWVSKYKPSPTE